MAPPSPLSRFTYAVHVGALSCFGGSAGPNLLNVADGFNTVEKDRERTSRSSEQWKSNSHVAVVLLLRNTRRNTDVTAFPDGGSRPGSHGAGQRLRVLERMLPAKLCPALSGRQRGTVLSCAGCGALLSRAGRPASRSRAVL